MTETATLTLSDFLLARIAEDEKTAREAHEENPQATWTAERTYDGVWAMDLHSEHSDSDSYGVGDDLRLPREMAKHIARWDPARVLAECAAKRQLVERFADRIEVTALDSTEKRYVPGAADTGSLRLLAQPYADHPDFREEWRV